MILSIFSHTKQFYDSIPWFNGLVVELVVLGWWLDSTEGVCSNLNDSMFLSAGDSTPPQEPDNRLPCLDRCNIAPFKFCVQELQTARKRCLCTSKRLESPGGSRTRTGHLCFPPVCAASLWLITIWPQFIFLAAVNMNKSSWRPFFPKDQALGNTVFQAFPISYAGNQIKLLSIIQECGRGCHLSRQICDICFLEAAKCSNSNS